MRNDGWVEFCLNVQPLKAAVLFQFQTFIKLSLKCTVMSFTCESATHDALFVESRSSFHPKEAERFCLTCSD